MTSRTLTLAVGLLLPAGVASQAAPRALSLGKPVAVYPEQFGLVNTVRELSNGQVMVADPLSGDLWLLDAALRSARKIGREGSGPGEYRQPDAVWPMPGDSTLLVDLGNARLSIFSLNGRYGRSMPIIPGGFTPGAGPPTAVMPRGIDARGRIYFQGSPMGRTGPLDSVAVLRFDPSNSRTDTIALVKGPSFAQAQSGSEERREVRIRPVPMAGGDGWAVASNGSVAIARVGSYRVDWVSPAGRQSSGPAINYERVRVGSAEKEEWAAFQQLVGGVGMSVENEDGRVSVSFARNRGQRPPAVQDLQWPDFKPPFDNGTARIDAAGRLWIQRNARAGQPNHYDVFATDGRLVASLLLPRDRRIAGFGAQSIYVVAFDSDGLQTLERYQSPM